MTERRRKQDAQECGECCSVQALIRIDDRGQMVLPKDVREKMGVRGGDKLALTTVEKDGRVCCLVLSRATDFGAMVRGLLDDVARNGSKVEESE